MKKLTSVYAEIQVFWQENHYFAFHVPPHTKEMPTDVLHGLFLENEDYLFSIAEAHFFSHAHPGVEERLESLGERGLDPEVVAFFQESAKQDFRFFPKEEEEALFFETFRQRILAYPSLLGCQSDLEKHLSKHFSDNGSSSWPSMGTLFSAFEKSASSLSSYQELGREVLDTLREAEHNAFERFNTSKKRLLSFFLSLDPSEHKERCPFPSDSISQRRILHWIDGAFFLSLLLPRNGP